MADELLVTVLAWTFRRILELRSLAIQVDSELDCEIRRQLDVAAILVDQPPLLQATEIEPTPSELTSVHREGRIWRGLAETAQALRSADDPTTLAALLLQPVPELRPTFFHLGVLGELLLALQATGASVISTGPLSHVTGQAQYKITTRSGAVWDLWFEAGGVWRAYGVPSPYRHLMSAFPGQSRPLAPDLVLIRPGDTALLFECKYSGSADYVGRSGLAQAALYVTELQDRLCPTVDAYVVPPEGVLQRRVEVVTSAGRLGLVPPSLLEQVVRDTLSEGGL